VDFEWDRSRCLGWLSKAIPVLNPEREGPENPSCRVLQPTVSFNAVLPEGGTLSVRLPLPGKFSYVAQLPAFLRE